MYQLFPSASLKTLSALDKLHNKIKYCLCADMILKKMLFWNFKFRNDFPDIKRNKKNVP